MSTSPVANPKGPRLLAPGGGPLAWADAYLGSTVGRKVLVALTGMGLVGFTVFHMIGNLKMFPGGPESQDHVNAYAHFLKTGLGSVLWIARGGLLTLFLVHVYLALRLQWKAAAARPVGYAYLRRAQATTASLSMASTGVVIGLFIAFHLAHYTFGLVKPATLPVPVRVTTHDAAESSATRLVPAGEPVHYLDLRDASGRHDVYNMVITGFRNPYISALYLVCQVVLFLHLAHGIQSSLQTLGLVGRRFVPGAKWVGYAVAGVILAGNVAIVVAVLTGYAPPVAAVEK